MSGSALARYGGMLTRRVRAGMIGQHWRGELTLGVSFWVNATLFGGTLPISLITSVGASSLYRDVDVDSWLTAMTWLSLFAICLPVDVWALVGTWRCAVRLKKSRRQVGAARAAQVALFIGVNCVVQQIMLLHLATQLQDCVLVAIGLDPLPAAEISVASDGTSISLNGALGSQSARRFAAAMKVAPQAKLVVLNSQGGRVIEGEVIAATVKRRNMDTFVRGECNSACTMIFLAGRVRMATRNAHIGFHSSSLAGLPGTGLVGSDRMLSYYRGAGLPADFIARVSDTGSESIWYPTSEELQQNNVVTRMTSGLENGKWLGLPEVTSIESVRALIARDPRFAAAEGRYPGSIDQAAAAIWEAKTKGATDHDAFDAAKTVLSALFAKALATAPDDVLFKMIDVSLEQFVAAKALGSDYCEKLVKSQIDALTTMPDEVLIHDSEFNQALFAAPGRTDTRLTASQTAFAFATVEATSKTGFAKAFKQAVSANDYDAQCDLQIAYYRAVNALPKLERGLAVRALYQGTPISPGRQDPQAEPKPDQASGPKRHRPPRD